jgi:nucleotide-binding universal stress UspA family protein
MSLFPTRMLLATDGSPEAERAAGVAAELSGKTGSELHVAHVRPVPGAFAFSEAGAYASEIDLDRVREIAEREAQRVLDEQAARMKGKGAQVAGTHARIGRPDEQVVRLAEDLGVGLIVIGSRGLGGVRRSLMGSVSDSVVRHAHCPVLVVRQEDPVGT